MTDISGDGEVGVLTGTGKMRVHQSLTHAEISMIFDEQRVETLNF